MRRNPAEVPAWDIGILERRYAHETTVMLIDVPRFLEVVAQAPPGELRDDLILRGDEYLMGYIGLAPRVERTRVLDLPGDPYACGDVYEVVGSAAQRGWGPLLYDTALYTAARDDKDGVVPDRTRVSAAAESLWRTYLGVRPDVECALLPPGCPLHDLRHLDCAYRICPDRFNTGTFEEMHRSMERAMAEAQAIAEGPNATEISQYIEDAGVTMFIVMFGKQLRKELAGPLRKAQVSSNPKGRRKKGLSPGTLPKGGAKKLDEVFWAVEESLLDAGESAERAATRASQVAWTEVKRHYYKRGKQWRKRKHPLGRPKRDALQALEGEALAKGAVDTAATMAAAANPPPLERESLKRRLMR